MRKRPTPLEPRAMEKLLAELEAMRARSFVFLEDQREVSYDLHAHSRHQLLYAFEGSARLEVEDARFVLPPQRAAFIPAGVRHVTINAGARMASVFLSKKLLAQAPSEVRVVSATPLLREMIGYAARWAPTRDPRDRRANTFFACLAMMCEEWLATPIAARLPRGQSKLVRAAIDHLSEHLSDATLEHTARAVGSSSRTLRRKLQEELGTSFRELLAQARLLRALELLSEPSASVTEVAFGLGYQSLSAFSHRFASFLGETPSAYRARSSLLR